MERVTDKSKKQEDNNLINSISQILTEIISENKSEIISKESLGKYLLIR
jgi:hypothetical protein